MAEVSSMEEISISRIQDSIQAGRFWADASVLGEVKTESVRPFNSTTDQGVIKMGIGGNEPSILAINGNVVFAKSLLQNHRDRELVAHERCSEASIPHLEIVAHSEHGSIGEGYIITLRENMLPVSESDISSKEQYEIIAWQMANSLTRLHQIGILHRDVKPANFGISLDRYSNYSFGDESVVAGEMIIYDFEYAAIIDGKASEDDHLQEVSDMLTLLEFHLEDVRDQKENDEYWFRDQADVAEIRESILEYFQRNY